MKVTAAKPIPKHSGGTSPGIAPLRADADGFLTKRNGTSVPVSDKMRGNQNRTTADAQPQVDKPSLRLLASVEIIAQWGPITFKDLGAALGLPKATTWRLVNTLRDANWVRLRKGGSVIELDPRIDDLFATANFADGEFCEVSEVINAVAEEYGIHVDLFTPDRSGELSLHDTSRRVTVASVAHEPLEEFLFLSLYAAMTPSQFDRHMTQMAGQLDAETLRNMNSAAMRRKVQQFPGYIWTEDHRTLFASLRGALGSAAALRLSGKSTATDKFVLCKAYEKLALWLPEKSTVLGKGKPTATGQ